MAKRRYKAFISYSHRDARVAGWLHHALETYRLPSSSLTEGRPARLHPIFKDREELPAADSLGDAIEAAIRASDALIVLCSPAAAASPWIAREIEVYKSLNGDRAIFPVIVEGDPPANFPAPLLVHYRDGQPTDEAAEPIAADLRPEGDGKRLAKLKLVAGLAGIELDQLVQRDATRRQRRLAMVAAGSTIGMLGTTALAAYAIDQRNEARSQRAEADGLIEYMLTDLRKQLEPVGRLEVLDGVGKRAMDYYARQKLADLSDTELGRRARATMLVAEVQNLRGNNEDALPAFEQAARTTEALLARNPDDPERMFNHGQSLFWVGYVAWQHGKLAEARRAMEEYAKISTRLAAKDRGNLDWQQEEAYALSNLGTLASEEGKLGQALDYFSKSATALDAISRTEGRPVERELELADARSWIASTLERLGDLNGSIAERERELQLLGRLISAQPDNNVAHRRMLGAKSAMGRLQHWTGKSSLALASLDATIAEGERQMAIDRDNVDLVDLLNTAWLTRGLLHWGEGREELSRRDFARFETLLTTLQSRDPENRKWNVIDELEFELVRALTDRAQAPAGQHLSLASSIQRKIKPGEADYEWMMVAAWFLEGNARQRRGESDKARTAYAGAAAFPFPPGGGINLRAVALRAAAASGIGDTDRAKSLREILKKAGATSTIERWAAPDRQARAPAPTQSR